MIDGGRCLRAFRPSRFSALEEGEYDETTELAKAINVELYAQRVQAGLPLFESGPAVSTAEAETGPQRLRR